MKKTILISAFSIILLVPVMAQNLISLSVDDLTFRLAAVFDWEETTHDFGKIAKNVPATHEFNFINTGEVPLVISSVKGSCGCTVTDYTKESIAPGKSGLVKATYNAAKIGAFHKTVTVTANTEDGPVVLSIKGEVLK